MKSVFEHIRDSILREPSIVSYEEMRESQWSDEFIRYMRNRMVMGGYRYGLLRDPKTPKFDNVGSLIRRAQLYLEDGNQEHLVDVANLALVEFVRECCHPAPHFSPVDDGYHTERKDICES